MELETDQRRPMSKARCVELGRVKSLPKSQIKAVTIYPDKALSHGEWELWVRLRGREKPGS
jgi:hypothetical protein